MRDLRSKAAILARTRAAILAQKIPGSENLHEDSEYRSGSSGNSLIAEGVSVYVDEAMARARKIFPGLRFAQIIVEATGGKELYNFTDIELAEAVEVYCNRVERRQQFRGDKTYRR